MSSKFLLEVKNLHASIAENAILKGLNLNVRPGEVHAIMGLNGSGKSTLASIIAGRDGYNITNGEIIFKEKNLLKMKPEIRAREGVFLAFQYPVELPGVNESYFLRTAVNLVREHRGLEQLSVRQFSNLLQTKASELGLSKGFLSRSVNEGFSGGEKKRNEVLQMALLEPNLCILDETDSGLDIDALQTVAKGVNAMRNKERSMIIITHYQRLLGFIEPDIVHIMLNGKIVKSGDASLAREVEDKGYSWLQSNDK